MKTVLKWTMMFEKLRNGTFLAKVISDNFEEKTSIFRKNFGTLGAKSGILSYFFGGTVGIMSNSRKK